MKHLWKFLTFLISFSVLLFALASCGEKDDEKDNHEHEWSEWTVVQPATCTEEGSQTRSCSCGEKQTQAIPALGHRMIEHRCEICDAAESQGLQFTSNDDGTCSVDGIGTCTDTDIIIPSVSPDGDTVTGIGYRAFEDCSSLTSITIPESVTIIIDYAFYGCSSLTSITIPDSVTSIGNYAFYGTVYYNSTDNWDNGVLYIGNHLIEAKTNISGAYNIKDCTKCIADEAFEYCSSLTSINIPEGVTSIGDSAFV